MRLPLDPPNVPVDAQGGSRPSGCRIPHPQGAAPCLSCAIARVWDPVALPRAGSSAIPSQDESPHLPGVSPASLRQTPKSASRAPPTPNYEPGDRHPHLLLSLHLLPLTCPSPSPTFLLGVSLPDWVTTTFILKDLSRNSPAFVVLLYIKTELSPPESDLAIHPLGHTGI